MTAITCINCGVEGVLKVHGLDENASPKVFKRVGRNHVSGHLHYQCPVCKIVLLVAPSLIREGNHIFKKTEVNHPLVPSDSTSNNHGIYPLATVSMPIVPAAA